VCVCVPPLRLLPLSKVLVSSDTTAGLGGAGASITGDGGVAAGGGIIAACASASASSIAACSSSGSFFAVTIPNHPIARILYFNTHEVQF
jgi:hypothetical protein